MKNTHTNCSLPSLKTNIILLLCLVAFHITSFAQNFQKTYGGGGADRANTVLILEDGYLVAGSISQIDNEKLLLLKTDFQGEIIWAINYGDATMNFSRSVIATNDGGFIAVGSSNSQDSDGDILVMKTNSNGDVQWTKTIGGNGRERGFSILQNPDDGYTISGSTMSYGAGHFDIFVTKITSDGNLIWSKVYGLGGNDSAFDMCFDTDGNYLLSGVVNPISGGLPDILAMKIDTEGNEMWIRGIGGSEENHGRSIMPTSDGGYLLHGHSISCGNTNYTSTICKLNPDGTSEWTKIYSESRAVNTLELPQGGYIVIDYFPDITIGGNLNTRINQLDMEGNAIKTTVYGGVNNDLISFAPSNSIQLIDDQTIVFALTSDSHGTEGADVQLVVDDIFTPSRCNTQIANPVSSNCPLHNKIVSLIGENVFPTITDINIEASILAFTSNNICCEPNPGSVSSEVQLICAGDSTSANHSGFQLNDGEVGAFILHTNANQEIGEILAIHPEGAFSLNSNEQIQPYTTYYLSPIVGPEGNLSDIPDLEDACTEIGAGTPIVFFAPISHAIDELCDVNTGNYVVTIQLSGGYPEYDNSFNYTVSGDFQSVITYNEVFSVVFPGNNPIGYTFNIEDNCGTELLQGVPFECGKIPIEFLEFTGEMQAEGNLLQWATATESNNAFFTLARSQNGDTYETFATVKSKGNSENLQSYTFTDKNPFNQLIYYQLSQTDLNGYTTQLATISVHRNPSRFSITKIYPNPSQGRINVEFSLNEGCKDLEMTIANVNGKVIHHEAIPSAKNGLQKWVFDTSSWKEGCYILEVACGMEILTEKIIID